MGRVLKITHMPQLQIESNKGFHGSNYHKKKKEKKKLSSQYPLHNWNSLGQFLTTKAKN